MREVTPSSKCLCKTVNINLDQTFCSLVVDGHWKEVLGLRAKGDRDCWHLLRVKKFCHWNKLNLISGICVLKVHALCSICSSTFEGNGYSSRHSSLVLFTVIIVWRFDCGNSELATANACPPQLVAVSII